MLIDNNVEAIYSGLKQEINQEITDAIAKNNSPNVGITPGTLAVINNIVLTKCSTAKNNITAEWTKILRGGKSIPKELGMLDEFDKAMKALAELRKLKSEVAIKKQKMQESWSKLVKHDPDVVLDPNLPNPYNEREGGNDYDS